MSVVFRSPPNAMQHFKNRPQFQAALAGKLVAKSTHFAMHQVELNLQTHPFLPALFSANDLWMGAMVPKRWAKRAVTRNTIKRQIYSVSAAFHNAFPPAAILVRLRREFSRQVFPSATSVELRNAVRAELLGLMQTAQVTRLSQEPAS